ncbi:MAG: hypothetical protein ACYC6N_32340 [Pirellulaceae bacterium]
MTGPDANRDNVPRAQDLSAQDLSAQDPSSTDFDQAAVPEGTVWFRGGPLAGLEGIIVDRRESGRYLVQLHHGVYVEASRDDFSVPASPPSSH